MSHKIYYENIIDITFFYHFCLKLSVFNDVITGQKTNKQTNKLLENGGSHQLVEDLLM